MSPRTIYAALLMFAATVPCGADPAVRLGGVLLEGAVAYTPEALLPTYRADLGAPLSDPARERIVEALVKRYEADGYLRPTIAAVDVHEASGVMVVTVREPHVARVSVAGKEHVADARFWRLIEELKQERPLARGTFHTWIARANALGSMAVRGSLVPAAPGGPDYVAELQVAPHRWTGVAHIDNRAPEALGFEMVQLQTGYRFADERAGHLRVAAAVALDAERLKHGSFAGTHHVNVDGTAFDWSVSRSTSSLENTAGGEDEYERRRATLGLTFPIYRRPALRLDTFGSLHLYDSEKHDPSGTQVRDERIRSAELGFTFAAIGAPSRRHDLTLSLVQGLDTMGARVAAPANTDAPVSDYLRLDSSYRLIQTLGDSWRATFNVQAQLSADHVPVSERFFIGGRQLGGAFEPASVTGDSGLGVRAEMSRRMTAPFMASPVDSYVYYDYGLSRSNNPDFPSDDAASAGVGLRMSIGRLAAHLELATPIEEPESNALAERGTRVFFALTHRFL